MRWEQAQNELLQRRITVVMRESAQQEALNVVRALAQGGLSSFEITFESPLAAEAIARVKSFSSNYLVGAGTVLDLVSAQAAQEAAADFIFCPHLNEELLRFGQKKDLLVIPGIYTPSELMAAARAGATVVKLFPAATGGPSHLKALRGPFPELCCIPTGGIDAANLPSYIRAGAAGVGLGGSLVDSEAISRGDWKALTNEAEKIVSIAKEEGWLLR